MQHFSVEELKQIKATVLQQHFRIEPEIPQEKFVEDNVSGECYTVIVRLQSYSNTLE